MQPAERSTGLRPVRLAQRAGRGPPDGSRELPGKLLDDLLAYCGEVAALTKVPEGQELSLITQYKQAAKTRKEPLEDYLERHGLLTTEVPLELAHLWDLFMDFSAGRGSSMNGPEPIELRTIREWCETSGVQLEWWEIDVIRRLDRRYRKVICG